MLTEREIRELVEKHPQVNNGPTVKEILNSLNIPQLQGCKIHEGKVTTSVTGDELVARDGTPIRLMFRSGDISTHDKKRGSIPFKDQVLAVNHRLMRDLVREYIGTSEFDIDGLEPNSTVIAAENLSLLPFENVVRQYMAQTSTDTSLYQTWKRAKEIGETTFKYAGEMFETDELEPNGKLERLLSSPSTKSDKDITVSPQFLIKEGIVSRELWERIEAESHLAFRAVQKYLNQRGLDIADTKTEHGISNCGIVKSADELYTMDSSRIWIIDPRTKTLELDSNGKPKSFSKEFARDMAVNNKSQFYSPEQQNEIAIRYIQGIQDLTGDEFKPDLRDREQRIIQSTKTILENLL